MEGKISWCALLVLAIFYGIYFVKMLVQKRHGIQTHQIGSRKELHKVEKHMSIAMVGVVMAQLISIGFDFMYLGVLLMYFNGLTVLFTVYAMVMLHLQIKQEEKYLAATFGEGYQIYQKQVRRYLGGY